MLDIIAGLILVIVWFGVKLVLHKRNSVSYDGRIIITKDEEGVTRYSLLVDEDLDVLEHKKSITFVVNHASEAGIESE